MLRNIFSTTAQSFDQLLMLGMDAAIGAGLAWVAPALRTAMMLYVLGYGFLTLYQHADGWTFVTAAMRAIAIGMLIQSTNYNFYVRDLFFTDLPNAFAAALNGPRITVNSAQTFDKLWEASLHMCGYVLGQAAGWTNVGERAVVWVLLMLMMLALWICFIVWYISRVFMALFICVGAFLLVLALFRSTRGYVQQWVGKLVGLTMLQLSSSILLRLVLAVLWDRMATIQNDPKLGIDELLNNVAGVTGVFWMGALLMIALPSAIAIGSSVGAGAAVTTGLLGGVAGRAAGAASGAAGGAGRATAGAARGAARAVGRAVRRGGSSSSSGG